MKGNTKQFIIDQFYTISRIFLGWPLLIVQIFMALPVIQSRVLFEEQSPKIWKKHRKSGK